MPRLILDSGALGALYRNITTEEADKIFREGASWVSCPPPKESFLIQKVNDFLKHKISFSELRQVLADLDK